MKKFEAQGGSKDKVNIIKTVGESLDKIQKSIFSEVELGNNKIVFILSPHKLTDYSGFAGIKKFILNLKKELKSKGVALVILLSTSTNLALMEIVNSNMDIITPTRAVSIVKSSSGNP